MIDKIYIFIIILQIIGAIFIYIINRKKSDLIKKNSWKKFFGYITILNINLYIIVYQHDYIKYLFSLIIISSIFEILYNTYHKSKILIGILTLILFLFPFISFYQLSYYAVQNILTIYITVLVFDAASQIIGQLIGKYHFVSSISPNKTLEGFVGAIIFTICFSFSYQYLLQDSTSVWITKIFAIIILAFFGDLIASYFKRKFGIKDYSNLLPGQGGFLDRFDSMLFASMIVFFLI